LLLSVSSFAATRFFYSDFTMLTALRSRCNLMNFGVMQLPYTLIAASLAVMSFKA